MPGENSLSTIVSVVFVNPVSGTAVPSVTFVARDKPNWMKRALLVIALSMIGTLKVFSAVSPSAHDSVPDTL